MARLGRQTLENCKLSSRKADWGCTAPYLVGGGVEGQICNTQDLWAKAAPCECAKTGEEHFKRKGLREVVVGARIEASHNISYSIAAGKHQNGDLAA